MRTTTLFDNGELRTFALIFDDGDEPVELITGFARDNRISAASMTAVGACRNVTLGYFDTEIMQYRSTEVNEQVELLSLIGDIATKDGEPTLHAHVVLGRKDSSAVGGHLQRANVFPTLEVVLTETPAHLRKRIDPHTGLALIAIEE